MAGCNTDTGWLETLTLDGGEAEGQTGNYYYRNRYYRADHGRFMSNDPIGYGDGLDMYAYAGNDPVNRYDPMGLASDSKTLPGHDDEVIPTVEEITTTAPRTGSPGGLSAGAYLAASVSGAYQGFMQGAADGLCLCGGDRKIACSGDGGYDEEFVITAKRLSGTANLFGST